MKKMDTEITRICGHIELSNKRVSESEDPILCQACYKSIKNTEHAAANKLAAQQNEQFGLPKLEGTDNQVAWAESIRAEMVPQLEGYVAAKQKYTASPENAEYLSACAVAWAEIAKKIKSVSIAVWFIDHEYNLISNIRVGSHDYGNGKFVISTMDYEVLKMKRLQYLRDFKIRGEKQEG
jgi:hypothetical protein